MRGVPGRGSGLKAPTHGDRGTVATKCELVQGRSKEFVKAGGLSPPNSLRSAEEIELVLDHDLLAAALALEAEAPDDDGRDAVRLAAGEVGRRCDLVRDRSS